MSVKPPPSKDCRAFDRRTYPGQVSRMTKLRWPDVLAADCIIQNELAKIQLLVGPIEREQFIHVDCFVGKDVGVFMPVTGPCYYAISPLHTHPSYMFTIAFNEQLSIKLDEDIILSPQGKILALSPGIPHHEVFLNRPPRYLAILINKDFFEEQLFQYPLARNVVFRGKAYHYSPALLSRLKEFMLEVDNIMPGSEAFVQAVSIELCHLIIRSIFNFEHKKDRISYRLEIDKTIEYMFVNLYRKVTVEELSRIAHMAPSYYARLFKRETGQTPMNYLNQLRMERVKKLLLGGTKSITEIAGECGFSSSAYLASRFYKSFNMTPSDYQRSLEKGSISK